MLTTAWGPVGTRGGCGAGWGPGACPGGNALQWGLRGAIRSHPNEDKHQAPSSTPPRPLSLQDPGPQTSMDMIPRFGRQNSSGYDRFWSLMFIIDSSTPASRQGTPQEDRAEVRTIVVGIQVLALLEETYYQVGKWSGNDFVGNFEDPLCENGFEHHICRNDSPEGNADKD